MSNAENAFNDVLEKLATAFENAVTLEIHTVVADVDVVVQSDPAGGPVDVELKPDPTDGTKSDKAVYTAINQFSGDVKTVWGANFDPTADNVLFDTHNENVKLSSEIFARNIKMVGDLIKKFAE
jgi:GH35 family endo-1,4-beta-xylanase